LTGGVGPNYRLLASMKNVKVYSAFVPNSGGSSSTNFTVTHVWGNNYYEMGYAQGAGLKKAGINVNDFIARTWVHLEQQVEQALPNYFPAWFAKAIADMGLDLALDLTELATEYYTDDKFFQELKGLSDATGIDYKTLVRVHMIAGLTQGKCSMFGMWGDALLPTYPSKLIQLRALDWDMDGPFRDYSAITVYHPSDGTNAHINIGMTGFVGGLTGLNEHQLAISEIGVSYPDASFGSESRIGVPFIYLLRDILRYDTTVDDATARMANAARTCDLILGVGDGKLGEFKGYAYSSSKLSIFDDHNQMPYTSWHPRIKDVVYWGMDWVCPAYNTVLSQQILKYYGQITPELAIKYLMAVELSGDNHLAVYDLTQMLFWVSFAAPNGVTGSVNAFDRQFVKFNATKLLRETAPSF